MLESFNGRPIILVAGLALAFGTPHQPAFIVNPHTVKAHLFGLPQFDRRDLPSLPVPRLARRAKASASLISRLRYAAMELPGSRWLVKNHEPSNKDQPMPILLWLIGVPVSLILILMLAGVIRF
jgi:hypothetical protein